MLKLGISSLFFLFVSIPCYAQAPAFATQTPLQGNSGSSFFVFLPVANVGSGDATNIEITSAALTLLGSPVAQLKVPSALPYVVGFAAPTGVQTLDLEFDNTRLISGDRYLLKISGSYQSGATTFGFALNRFITYSRAFSFPHEQVLQSITAKFDSLPGADAQADDQVMLSFVQGLPQVASAGLQVDPPLVWVNFNDGGERLDILNNIKLPAVPFLKQSTGQAAVQQTKSQKGAVPMRALAVKAAATATAGSPTELPQSRQVRIVSSMGSGFDDPSPDIKLWLIIHGYDPATDADASLDSLRNVGGDGVFYISAHGGIDKDEKSLRVRTSTLVNSKCNPNLVGYNADLCSDLLLPDDITNKRVIVTVAKEKWNSTTKKWISEDHYSIDKAFVEHYNWSFAANSLVYIDTCHSNQADPNVQAFKETLIANGASVYVGWTEEVGSGVSADTARLVFDRLLGANMFCPEDGAEQCSHGPAIPPAFAQRPFDYTQVAFDLPKHNLGADTKPTANLKFDATGSFGLLAPSIMTMIPMEGQQQLLIQGSFGSVQDTVTIGGTPVGVLKWSEDGSTITTDLPSGAAGDVVVTVNGHKSNAAQLTKWIGGFTATLTGPESAKQTVVFQTSFRADVRKFRVVIHDPPFEPSSSAIELVNSESSAPFACSGTYSFTSPGRSDTYTWKGAGSLKPFDLTSLMRPPSSPYFFIVGALVMSHTEMSMQLNVSQNLSVAPCEQDDHIVFSGPPPSQLDNNNPFDIQFSTLDAKLRLNDTTAVIAADDQSFTGHCSDVAVVSACAVKLHWDSIAPALDSGPNPVDPR